MSDSGINQRYDILEAIGQIARDKNVNRDLVVETLKAGLLSAAKKRFGDSDHVTVDIDLNTGLISMAAEWDVVEQIENPFCEITLDEARHINPKAKVGEKVVEPLRFEDFGRHAIHSAKQSLIQKVREAERDKVYEDYSQRINEIVTGSVQQVLHGDIYINLGRAEAILPHKHQIRRERYHQGNTVRALIVEVKRDAKGPQVVLSRTDPKFLAKLFEFEVPEIYEGIVEIKGVARKPGERSKIAVLSSDPRVDSVGACVGIKGSRVQGIVKELNNERIDIIQYSDDISTFLSRSLSPAPVLRVDIDRVEGKLTAVVDDDQLSLAIGKNGINAELASNLTGLTVNIISQSVYVQSEAEKRKEAGLLIDMKGIGEKMVFNLNGHSINTIRDLALTNVNVLLQIPGVGPKTAEKLIEMAKDYFRERELNSENTEPPNKTDSEE
ncbi:MAG: transcription termination factor NusA [Candidatus Latescibacteria bacterium]|nr:transcription termination factor NusA [Candidatus Latescibacterota bacterium]